MHITMTGQPSLCFKQHFLLVELLKECAKTKNLRKGVSLHSHILEKGLFEKNPYIGSNLINMYVRCDMLTTAQQVLDDLPTQDVVSWNALITGYVRLGQGHSAILHFQQMRKIGLSPNEVTYICVLKACGSIGAIDMGSQIHEEIVVQGLLVNTKKRKANVLLGNALVDMYVKCGMLAKAQKVLGNLPGRDAISWSVVISGYAQAGRGLEALECFALMQEEGFSPDDITFTSVLKACSSIGDLDMGKQVHDQIIRRGFLLEEKHVMLGNALMDMYAKCGMLPKARQVLELLPVRDIVSWNTLIAGYVQNQQSHEALDCFAQMQREGLSPDETTLACILEVCGNTRDINTGKQIYNEIVDKGLLKKNLVLATSLVDMYVKCGMLRKARQVLDELHDRDTVCWSSLIAGYVHEGQSSEALKCFEEMKKEGVCPNEVTFISILKACGSIGAIKKGEQVHHEITIQGLIGKNIALCNALVDMYAKCGLLSKARQVLEELPVRNVVSWNALITGYAQHELGHEVLKSYASMVKDGKSPNEITYSSLLKACGSIGAINKGVQIHNEIVERGLMEKNIVIGTALVDMYAKCGVLEKAQQALEELPVRDIVSWSVLIRGYAQQGQSHEALNCFVHMQNEGLFPDEITFICVLNACSHSGEMCKAQTLYDNMTKRFGVAPKLKHHTSMVLVFGCAGHFDKVISVIEMMPSFYDCSLWLALLCACKKWGNVKLGRHAFDQAIQMSDNLAAAYVHMGSIYADAGMQEDMEKVQAMQVMLHGQSSQAICMGD